MRQREDRWLDRLRFLLGSGAFAWEVGFDHHQRWWVIVASIWLLGGPIEKLLSLITTGRLHITVRQSGADDEEESGR